MSIRNARLGFARIVEHPDKQTRSRPRAMVDDEAQRNLQFGPFELSSKEMLLRREFECIEVRYASPGTKFYNMALRSWSVARPLQTVLTYIGGVINSVEDRIAPQTSEGVGMQELIAVAYNSTEVPHIKSQIRFV